MLNVRAQILYCERLPGLALPGSEITSGFRNLTRSNVEKTVVQGWGPLCWLDRGANWAPVDQLTCVNCWPALSSPRHCWHPVYLLLLLSPPFFNFFFHFSMQNRLRIGYFKKILFQVSGTRQTLKLTWMHVNLFSWSIVQLCREIQLLQLLHLLKSSKETTRG